MPQRIPFFRFSLGRRFGVGGRGEFFHVTSVAFDPVGGLVFVPDCGCRRIQVFSTDDDGLFVSMFGHEGSFDGEFNGPIGVAIDHKGRRVFAADSLNHRLQVFSMEHLSFLFSIGRHGVRPGMFRQPTRLCVDSERDRVMVVDSLNQRVQVLSTIDGSYLFELDMNAALPPQCVPNFVELDKHHDRIIVGDLANHRVLVYAIDGSFLFEFGSFGKLPGQFNQPSSVCIDNHGRIIVADARNSRLQAFTPYGRYISSFECTSWRPWGVAFDEYRGLIAFTAGNQVHAIEANQWLPDTFIWRPDRHAYAPKYMKQAALTMAMIRSLVHESIVSLVPNELLFLIFEML